MTICALSTLPGRSAVAMVRISGPATKGTLQSLCQGNIPAPRVASLRKLRDPQSGEVLDRGLVIWFPGPSSFTGEDMAELQIHGGRAVISNILDVLIRLGLRIAEPGEFTKRAFENGKLDLTEVEGLADLINADTPAQRRQALLQSEGALRNRYEGWRATLLRAMAYVEASIDFSDERDIADDAFQRSLPEVRLLAAELEHALLDGKRGEIVREGIQVAIIGAPNVGKSSLLNAIAGREAAIVFDEPGTTRDVIEIAVDLDGFPFVFRDTAGLRETENAVEHEGVRRALAAARDADVILAVKDATEFLPCSADSPQAPAGKAPRQEGLSAFWLQNGYWPGTNEEAAVSHVIVVWNKVDLLPSQPEDCYENRVACSAKTGKGIGTLKEVLATFARDNFGKAEAPLITRGRHRQEIERASRAIESFLARGEAGNETELAAEHLREAADALGRLTGRLDVEEVLGQIFSEFCIGK